MQRVLLEMSGGVDSSLSALLLREAGYEVVGLTMSFAQTPDEVPGRQVKASVDPSAPDWGANFSSAVRDAAAVCAKLGIEHRVVYLRSCFVERVLSHFLDEYSLGRTACPCARCNVEIKFGKLLEWLPLLHCDYVATGHYVRGGARGIVAEESDAGAVPQASQAILSRARDRGKDQSYFLAGVPRERLQRALFPLGEYSKAEVRAMARERGIVTAEKADSQDLCFVPSGQTADFLDANIAAGVRGTIETQSGQVLGYHNGLHKYTIGQRRGLGICSQEKLYVVELDSVQNRLVVGPESSLYARNMKASDMNWLASDAELLALGLTESAEQRSLSVAVQYRSTHAAQMAEVTWSKGDPSRAEICFAEPQRSLCPGQRAVLYAGDDVLGGATIDEVW